MEIINRGGDKTNKNRRKIRKADDGPNAIIFCSFNRRSESGYISNINETSDVVTYAVGTTTIGFYVDV